MTKVFGYVRVSTAKQGEGVSLSEQRDSIDAYAAQNGLQIVEWFEEKETAAKRGRPVFSEMLKRLRKGDARGLVIHKIDRSARNLRDWADLDELMDEGIEIHFAHESLDLNSNGGRLSADLQAVIAANYIRNLSDETKKGHRGRLKQGNLAVSRADRLPEHRPRQGRRTVDPVQRSAGTQGLRTVHNRQLLAFPKLWPTRCTKRGLTYHAVASASTRGRCGEILRNPILPQG